MLNVITEKVIGIATFVTLAVSSLFMSVDNNLGQTFAFPLDGGTGTSTAPTTNDILIGNSSGVYDVKTLTAGSNVTIDNSGSSVTISSTGGGGGSFAWTPETYGVSTSTTLGFGNGFISQASSTITASTTISGVFTAISGIFGNLTGNVTGNADTATALAANGANCSSGNAPLGVDASGAVESCFDVWTEAENTSANYLPTSDFGSQFFTFFNATNTDALSEGSSNLYWTNDRFDARLSASTTIPTLTTLANLTTVGTISTGVWNGTAIDISDYTNLAVSSPITLTGDTVGFDFSGNNTWTGTGTTTFNGDVEIDGNLQVDGNFFAPITITSSGDLDMGGFAINNAGTITGTTFVATSTTATSTIAGGLAIETSGFVYDYSSNRVGIGTANPVSRLHLISGGATAEEVFSVSDATPTYYFQVFNPNTGGNAPAAGNATLKIRGMTTTNTAISAGGNVKTTGEFLSGNGTVGAPGFSFLNDTDTGLYLSSDGNPAIATAGSNGLILNNTHAAFNGLSVNPATDGNWSLAIGGTGTTGSGVLQIVGDAQGAYRNAGISFIADNSGAFTKVAAINQNYVNATDSGELDFFTKGTGGSLTSRLVITDAGDVESATSLSFRLEQSAGSASGPTFSFKDDEDTGVFRAAANELGLSTSGTERLRIDASGNIGIGTTSPLTTLHVENGQSGLVSLHANADDFAVESNGNTGLTVLTPDGNSGQIYFGSPSNNRNAEFRGFYNSGSPYLGLWINSSEKARLLNNGNFGIGTTTPWGRLSALFGDTDVGAVFAGGSSGVGSVQNTGSELVIESSGQTGASILFPDAQQGNFYFGSPSDTDAAAIQAQYNGGSPWIRFSTGGTERVRFFGSDKVGIATSSPSTSYFGAVEPTLTIESKDSAGAAGVAIANSTSAASYAQLALLGTGHRYSVGIANAGETLFEVADKFYIFDAPNNLMRLVLDTAGNFGIGTTTPDSKLVVEGLAQSCSTALSDGATITINWDNCNTQTVTLGGNRTIAFSNLDDNKIGAKMTLVVTQDATAGRTLTFPASVNWGSAGAPTLSSAAGETEIISLIVATSSATIHARFAD